MSVTVTLNFNSREEAVAFLAGKPAAVSAAPTAPSPSTAAAPSSPAAAPATKALDFDKDVVPALKGLNTKDKKAFGELMKKFSFTKVADVQAKPETWGEVVAACA